MTTPHGRSGLLAALAVALAATGAAPPASGQEVGTAAAVRPSSTGTPPGAPLRELQVGTRLVSDERIQTTGSGSLQVMFLDRSSLTVGPNSDMVIDRFVYNPAEGTGEFGIRLAGGALRFVGGQISHRDGATITTPVATIGIRGGVAVVKHDLVCETLAASGGRTGEACTKVVCMGGICTVDSLIDARRLQLRINEAVEIGSLGAVQFDASAAGLGGIAAQQTTQATGTVSSLEGTAGIIEQLPEPTAPPPPPPNEQ